MFDQKMYPRLFKKAALLFVLGSQTAYSETSELPVEALPREDKEMVLEGHLNIGVGDYDGKLGVADLFIMGDRHHWWMQGGIGHLDFKGRRSLAKGGLGGGYRYLVKGDSLSDDKFFGGYAVVHAKNSLKRINIDVGGEIAYNLFQLTLNYYGTLKEFYKPTGDIGFSGKLALYPSWLKMQTWGRASPIVFLARTKVNQANQWGWNAGWGARLDFLYYLASSVEFKCVWDQLKPGIKGLGGINFESGLTIYLDGNLAPEGHYPIHRLREAPQRYRPSDEGYPSVIHDEKSDEKPDEKDEGSQPGGTPQGGSEHSGEVSDHEQPSMSDHEKPIPSEKDDTETPEEKPGDLDGASDQNVPPKPEGEKPTLPERETGKRSTSLGRPPQERGENTRRAASEDRQGKRSVMENGSPIGRNERNDQEGFETHRREIPVYDPSKDPAWQKIQEQANRRKNDADSVNGAHAVSSSLETSQEGNTPDNHGLPTLLSGVQKNDYSQAKPSKPARGKNPRRYGNNLPRGGGRGSHQRNGSAPKPEVSPTPAPRQRPATAGSNYGERTSQDSLPGLTEEQKLERQRLIEQQKRRTDRLAAGMSSATPESAVNGDTESPDAQKEKTGGSKRPWRGRGQAGRRRGQAGRAQEK